MKKNIISQLATGSFCLLLLVVTQSCDHGKVIVMEKELTTSENLVLDDTLQSRVPVSGQNWVSPHVGISFVWIEKLGLWVGKYEVTNAEFRRMIPGHDSGTYHRHALNDDRQPAVNLRFDDAREYASWLNEQDSDALGQARYRLPSEKEWLAFAQCGDEREFPWGNGWPPPDGSAGNYHGQEGFEDMERIDGYADGYRVTAPVDDTWCNPWGLHGVGGNVWEACAADEKGVRFGAWRGASWKNHFHATLRCTARHEGFASHRDNDYGFRLVLSIP